MELNRQAYLALLNEGKAAFAAGDPSDACPYDQYSADPEQQFGARYWAQGWIAARTAAEAKNPEAEASTGQ
ncbi:MULTISPECIES: hypothetical protein [Streptomyces]|uniref:Ribosome modulation factor n=1 Tax=Streptomyces rhizosphaericus TaxID=114699 RepID=A0A6G4AMA4_9ACTN|nr:MULTISPECIES: hypothetical protein [Streptomyces]EXU69664.1 hypothetical protein Z951_03020 [Streptomyces sp. PRh5]NEW73751.1 hypothetical protein [Streptomyces rhizosphaericus]